MNTSLARIRLATLEAERVRRGTSAKLSAQLADQQSPQQSTQKETKLAALDPKPVTTPTSPLSSPTRFDGRWLGYNASCGTAANGIGISSDIDMHVQNGQFELNILFEVGENSGNVEFEGKLDSHGRFQRKFYHMARREEIILKFDLNDSGRSLLFIKNCEIALANEPS